MNWEKLLLPPVAIYAVIFLFISALVVGFKMDAEATWVWIVSLLITIVGLYLATNYAKPSTRQEGLKYGIAWLVVFVVLDLILTAPFAGWDYFSDWKSYVSHVLTLAVPMLLAKSSSSKPTGTPNT